MLRFASAVMVPSDGYAAILKLETDAPDFGGRRLVGHDIKHVIEWWLTRGTPPAFDDVAVGAYLLNPARTSYRLAEVSVKWTGLPAGITSLLTLATCWSG